jgi:hypothetical protein
VRLLGIDAAEVSFTMPVQPPTLFVPIKSQAGTTFLTDPFASGLFRISRSDCQLCPETRQTRRLRNPCSQKTRRPGLDTAWTDGGDV